MNSKKTPRVLIFDIETAPLEVLSWGIRDQHIGVSQIKKDRSILCFAAKWLGEKDVMFHGTGGQKDVREDRFICERLHKILSQADVLITQNGRRFDLPIVKGRFLVHGLKPLPDIEHIDTCVMARSMGLVSAKLEYLTELLCPHLAKSKHNSFPGMDLWKACLGMMGASQQKKAWREMSDYNKQDVRGTEGVYERLVPWGNNVEMNAFHEGTHYACTCGGTEFMRNGLRAKRTGVYTRLQCRKCGRWYKLQGAENNLMSAEKKRSLKNVGGK